MPRQLTQDQSRMDAFGEALAPLYRESMINGEPVSIGDIARGLVTLKVMNSGLSVRDIQNRITYQLEKHGVSPAKDYAPEALKKLNRKSLAEGIKRHSHSMMLTAMQQSGWEAPPGSGDIMERLYSFCNRFAPGYYEAMKSGNYINLRIVGDRLAEINFFNWANCTGERINQMVYHQIAKIFQCPAKKYSSASRTAISGKRDALRLSRLLTIRLTEETIREVENLDELDNCQIRITIDELKSKPKVGHGSTRYVQHPKYLTKLCYHLAPPYKENMHEGKGINLGVIGAVWLISEPWSTTDPEERALVSAYIRKKMAEFNGPRSGYTELSGADVRVVSSAGTDINMEIKRRSIKLAKQILEIAVVSKAAPEIFETKKKEKKEKKLPSIYKDEPSPGEYIARFDQSMTRCKEALDMMCEEFIMIIGEASDVIVSENETMKKELLQGRKGIEALEKLHNDNLKKVSMRLVDAESKLKRAHERIHNQSSELTELGRKLGRHSTSLRNRIGKKFFGRRGNDEEGKSI